jgi:tetratricopeptide (TPR) repeat protein
VTRASDPLFLVATVVLILLVVSSAMFLARNRLVSFALLALVASPLTAYALMPLADVVAEHRVYIAGLGSDLMAASLLTWNARRAWAALAGVSLLLSFLTLERNRVWANDLTLWQDAARKSPRHARAHLNLAGAYHSTGNVDAAIPEYLSALAINPRLSPAYMNLGVVFLLKGDLDRAEPLLRKAAELAPTMPEPYLNLAVLATRRGQGREALDLVSKAESLGGSDRAHLIKGDALRLLERYTDARREYELALALLPEDPVAQEQARARLKALTAR